MVIIAKESKLEDVFANYKNVAAFTTTSAKKGVEIAGKTINYVPTGLLPSADDINAIKDGSKKIKKVIKNAVKMLYKPASDGAYNICLNVGYLITMLTSDRRNKNGPPVVVFVLDDEDDVRNNIVKKYLTGILKEFGIAPMPKKAIGVVFDVSKKELRKANKKPNGKKRKKKDRIGRRALIKRHVVQYESAKKNKCGLSKDGLELKRQILRYYDIELRQFSASNLKVTELNGSTAQSWAKALATIYSAENLKDMKKSFAKKLSKKDKNAVKAYNEIRKILRTLDQKWKLPKVEYGQKKKKKVPVGAKFSTKKFIKFYSRYRNRAILLLIFAHTTLRSLDYEIGSKEYNREMKQVCDRVGEEGFSKLYLAAAGDYAKRKAEGSIK